MDKKIFINEFEKRLDRLNEVDKNLEINKLSEYIENGIAKGISEADIINSLGSVDDIVKTIYIQKGIKINKNMSFKESALAIWEGLKEKFLSKDKKIIIGCVRDILIVLIVAIILKIPFIFIRTMFLDGLNSINISYVLQNFIEFIFEISYIWISLLYIYKRLKKIFVSKA